MKKLFIFTAVLLFAVSASQAQEIRFGAKAGLNVASLGGDSYSGLGSLGSRTSFHLGALVEIPIMDKWSVQPELLYSSEGSDWGYYFGSDKTKLDYIRIPVLAKYHIIKGLSGEAGPSFGIMVNADVAGNDVKDNYNAFDAAFAIGASYQLDMGVFFSLRYNKGITNVNKKFVDVDGYSWNYKNQSNVFQISAGYSF